MDRLIEKITQMQNPTVVGLDPTLDYIPSYIKEEAFKAFGETLKGAAEAVLRYNKDLIDALYDIVPAVKPQLAYYEMFGYEGVRAFYDTVQYAKSKGMYVISDGKRNDIGSTMEAYAKAHLGEIQIGSTTVAPFGGDALTVNGYLGTDGIKPLLGICKEKDKDIFVLVKTSNPSSGELQDRQIEGKEVYRMMGHMCTQWGSELIGKYGYSAVGAVVGATYPKQLSDLRQELPHTFFLVPGFGAQGGTAQDVAGAFDKRGQGAIINSSRGIITAWKKEGLDNDRYPQAARRAALQMKEEITAHLPTITL